MSAKSENVAESAAPGPRRHISTPDTYTGITLQALLHKQRKAPEATSHICMPRREPDAHIPRDRNHRCVIASMTAFTRSDVAAPKIRSRAPFSKSSSMTGADDAGMTVGTAAFASGAAIITGTSCGGASTSVRAWRRQENSRLAEIPYRRATVETFAPGTNVSSMICVFSSSDHRRRRSIPLRTSALIKTDLKHRLKVRCFAETQLSARWRHSDAYGNPCSQPFIFSRMPIARESYLLYRVQHFRCLDIEDTVRHGHQIFRPAYFVPAPRRR
ncbi:hypothetical protein MHY1_01426 [Methylovirgula sp. HY1]|nr:hypothetical protein MHY1_01426 [Methylovirgula sp. HY1]